MSLDLSTALDLSAQLRRTAVQAAAGSGKGVFRVSFVCVRRSAGLREM